ncbi:hypothetical protein TgHK011_000160 [Trichoderma gracile]|nr:hypothetical protein TgHK011_000160 [Trichoderma gracile]
MTLAMAMASHEAPLARDEETQDAGGKSHEAATKRESQSQRVRARGYGKGRAQLLSTSTGTSTSTKDETRGDGGLIGCVGSTESGLWTRAVRPDL